MGSCPQAIHVSFSCFPGFSFLLDPRDRLGDLERKVGVLVKNLRTTRVVYCVNVCEEFWCRLTQVIPDKQPLNSCCCSPTSHIYYYCNGFATNRIALRHLFQNVNFNVENEEI